MPFGDSSKDKPFVQGYYELVGGIGYRHIRMSAQSPHACCVDGVEQRDILQLRRRLI